MLPTMHTYLVNPLKQQFLKGLEPDLFNNYQPKWPLDFSIQSLNNSRSEFFLITPVNKVLEIYVPIDDELHSKGCKSMTSWAIDG